MRAAGGGGTNAGDPVRAAAMLRALRGVVRAIAVEKDPDRLAQLACEAVTAERGYVDAWIGRLQPDGRIVSVAHAGSGNTLVRFVEAVASGQVPACLRAALESPAPVVHVAARPECDCPWAGELRDWAVMTMRLEHLGRPMGVMYVTVPAEAAGDPEEAEAFRDVVVALAPALASFALADSQARALERLGQLSQAIEQVSVMVVIVDTSARILYVNPKFCQVTGFTAEEALGMTATDLGTPPPEESARMWEQLRQGKQWRGEMLKRRKDGTTYWESAVISAIHGPDGHVVQHVKVAEDVTERRAAVEALQRSEQKYRQLIETASDAIFLADAETGILLEVNSKAEELMGRPATEMVGRHQRTLHPPEEVERYEAIFRDHAARAGGMSTQGDVFVLRADGARVPIEINASVIDVGGRKVVHGIFRDITQRRQLEQQLRQAEKMQAIGQLAGGIAHDFNNRLVAILGFAELLARQLPEGSPRKYAERIVRNSRRAATLTGQLLAFARKANFQVVPVDLHAAIREVVLFLTHAIDKNISVRMHLAARHPRTMGDPAQLENAILNLALNARDAMPEGGALTLRTANVTLGEADRERLGLQAANAGYVSVAVIDTGTGIDESVRAHLFEPFFTTKKMGEGSGMGLAAVYGTVQSHGGAIQVDTVPGHGTTFTLYLPQSEAEPASTQPEPLPVRARDARILVVDDEADVRELVRDMLASLGYQVVTCRDGVEAVALYERESPSIDLVVLDMIMPRLGGRATLQRLRRINPEVRAILATGHGIEGQAADIIREGAVGFVQKPFALRELAEKVGRALEG